MLSILKELLPYEWRQAVKRRVFKHEDMFSRLNNLRRAGFMPKRAVDVGAFEGSWTRECRRVWPNLPSIMVEPLLSKRALLEKLADQVPGSRVISCATGRDEGEVAFCLGETNSRILTQGADGSDAVTVRCRRLDNIINETGGRLPDLVKLDVQGHELEVLRGGSKCLCAAEVAILEISILRIGDVPIFREVDRFMEEAKFQLYDLIPQYYRPLDGALWQIDAFYIPEASRLIRTRSWA